MSHYDAKFIDDTRRAAGLRPLTEEQHRTAANERLGNGFAERARLRRRMMQGSTLAMGAIAASPEPAQSTVPPATPAARVDPAEQIAERVRDAVRRAFESTNNPLGKFLTVVVAEQDKEARELWPTSRWALIQAGRKLVAENPKIDAAALRRHYQDAVLKVWKSLGIDGLDETKEISELVDLALIVAPGSNRQVKQPVAASFSDWPREPLAFTFHDSEGWQRVD